LTNEFALIPRQFLRHGFLPKGGKADIEDSSIAQESWEAIDFMEILAVTRMGAFDKSTPVGGQQGAVFGGDYRPTEILRCSLSTPVLPMCYLWNIYSLKYKGLYCIYP
jgi:hypothetical protein